MDETNPDAGPVAGIDIGSRSIELVVLSEGAVAWRAAAPTTFNPLERCARLLGETPDALRPRALVATGYGRGLVERLDVSVPLETITEIKAHAMGVGNVCPEARTVLDIGGQDTKAIALLPGGKVGRFEMNDRCAAGTGKFLEHTATVFQIPVEEFGAYALRGEDPPAINSMCTVFAETEATSLMARGRRPEDIALGLHAAIVRRTASMLGRVGWSAPVAFVGGVARNPCIVALLARELGLEPGTGLLVPDMPEMTGALGAALWGLRQQGGGIG